MKAASESALEKTEDTTAASLPASPSAAGKRQGDRIVCDVDVLPAVKKQQAATGGKELMALDNGQSETQPSLG